jgi:hypothetical protein
MNFQSVLIVTYGRSGSTLLQGLLNSIDGCLVRGENYNFCHGLFLAYQSVKRAKKEFGKGDGSLTPTSPWYGAAQLSEEKFIEDARRLVLEQLIPKGSETAPNCVGFKEIRYVPAGQDENLLGGLPQYLDFLAKLFPKPAFIVLSRNHDQVVNSAWWRSKNPDDVRARLKKFEADMAKYASAKPWIFPIRYEDLSYGSSRLAAMFEFLGVPFDEQKVNVVLNTAHSYQPKPGKFDTPAVSFPAFDVQLVTGSPLQHFAIDRRTEEDETAALKGVAVMKATETAEWRLAIRNRTGEHEVRWNMPSPAMVRKYPANPHAASSRFKVEGFRASPGAELELVLIRADGFTQRVALIRQKKRQGRRSGVIGPRT